MKQIKRYILFLFFPVLFSCSITKSLPEGDALYTGASVKIKDDLVSNKKKKSLKSELEALTRPRPNKKVLGIRFKLFMYTLAGNSKKEKSFKNWLKNKFGEPPVLLSDVNTEYNSKVLQSDLENQGFFHAKVTGDTTVKDRKASATYTVTTGLQYHINAISFPHDSSTLSRTILEDSSKTLLKKGDAFNLDIIKAERERIDAFLKEKGFYYFNPEFIIVQVDTTIGNQTVNLYVKPKAQTPDQARKIYTINDVYIFTNFRLNNAQNTDTLKKDAVFYKGYYVIDKRKQYKPKVFELSMQFDPGDVYSRTEQNQTISRLVNLGLFKFVKNRFEPAMVDSPKLNTYYYLTPFPKKSLRGEVNGNTKSNNLTGTSLTLGWRNRNTFKAGELFTIDGTGGLEYQYSSKLNGYNTYRAGAEANLIFPRFIIPFYKINTRSGFVPKTTLLLAYDILNKRKLYSLNSFRFAYGYNWKENIKKEHQFNPVAITYVQPLNVTQQYQDSVNNNRTLAKTIEKQFILGTTYNYNYNGLMDVKPGGSIYLNGNLDLSGNIAGIVSGANADTKPVYIANAQFSQYIRLEGEMRYYNRLSTKTTWANKLIAGFGYPYGNSKELPFIKQFFAGGNNSIRAFRSRSIGPGTYVDTSQANFLPDQSGDIKLELSTELRQKLFSVVHGAIFLDAGNTWLYHENTDKPGSKFTSNFLKELAVGTGVGLRFDLTVLVLRLDLAFPLRKPYLPGGQRWVINQVRFGDPDWRKENLILNLAIGYPF